jgi:hypothetical protein
MTNLKQLNFVIWIESWKEIFNFSYKIRKNLVPLHFIFILIVKLMNEKSSN